MIVQNGTLVGSISRTQILRWLRNQWAMNNGRYSDIIPDVPSPDVLSGNLCTIVEALKVELANIDSIIADNKDTGFIQDRERMVSVLSQCQDVMDQVLKYGSIPTQHDSVLLQKK
jgi:hypothetical protein